MNRAMLLRAILIASLACNVAVLITIALNGLSHNEAAPGNRFTTDGVIERLTRNLSTGDAEIVRQKFDADRKTLDEKQAELKKNYDGVELAMKAEPLDIEVVRAAMLAAQAARQNSDALIRSIILEALPNMTTTGRANLFPHHS